MRITLGLQHSSSLRYCCLSTDDTSHIQVTRCFNVQLGVVNCKTHMRIIVMIQSMRHNNWIFILTRVEEWYATRLLPRRPNVRKGWSLATRDYCSPWSERENWPFLKAAISPKPERPHPPKLVCMHVTSIPTCMNFLS